MTKILGLLTCFNRKEKTLRALENLIYGNPEVSFDFIVADDASTDGTAEAIGQLPGVQVLNGSGNLFYSGGMRLAMEKALALARDESSEAYDYGMLFNDDVDFREHAIEELLQGEKDTILVGPTCDDYGKLSYGGVLKKSRFRPKYEIIKAESAAGEYCDTFNANCVLIPWDIFLTLGNMDPVYTHSLGDFDYGLMASKRDFRVRVAEKFVGVCCDNPVHGSWRDTSLSIRERIHRKESPKGLPAKEWWHYLKKHYGALTAVIYSLTPYIRIFFGK